MGAGGVEFEPGARYIADIPNEGHLEVTFLGPAPPTIRESGRLGHPGAGCLERPPFN
jgi:hypothetical protein